MCIGAAVLLVATASSTVAQSSPAASLRTDARVVDMHLHAYHADAFGPPPQYICSPMVHMGHLDPADGFDQFAPPCENVLESPLTDDEIVRRTAAALEEHNVLAVASGPPDMVMRFKQAAPDRIIPALQFGVNTAPPPEELREMFTAGGFMVLGEVVTQYEGYAPNAAELQPYFALAEELDIPVALHMGPGPPAVAYTGAPGMRMANGDPFLLEDVLVRHPGLRIYVMHAGYPLLSRMVSIMGAHPQVYVDIAILAYAYPRDEFYAYLEGLVRAGMETRILYGSDTMIWPDAIGESIGVIEEADFLTPEQKKAILRDNALRFLRLEP